MELDQLKLFTDLVREQSFTKVAEKNFLTQPAVSLRIRNLEEELGTKLLERTTRKVLVTEEGRILYDYARDILSKAEEVKVVLLERQDKFVGSVRLATVHSIGLHELPAYLKRYISKYPQVVLHIDYHTGDVVHRMVQDGDVDLGIVAYPEPKPNLVILPFLEDELVAICNKEHAFARRESIRLQELNDQPFIAFDEGIPTRKAIDAVLARRHLRVNIKMQCDNIEILKKMVEVGLGVSLVPRFSVRAEVEQGVLHCLSISDYSFKRPLVLIHRKGKTLSRPMQAFVDILTEGLPPQK
jgi:LysR family transcriptional regulator, transcriptional activator of the cysJI operon